MHNRGLFEKGLGQVLSIWHPPNVGPTSIKYKENNSF